MRFALLTMLLATGCSWLSDLEEYKCGTDEDCGDGKACSVNGYCVLIADDAGEPAETGPECTATEPCAGGLLCSEGQCLPCDDTRPCQGADLCVMGQCLGEDEARWACVGDRPEEAMPGPAQVTLSIELRRRDGSESVPIDVDVTVTACELPTCDTPRGPFEPGDDGVVDVIVPQGFKGFVKMTGGELFDTFYQIQAPVNADRSAPLPITMLGEDNVLGLALVVGAEVDLEGRGIILFQVLDCLGERSPDVSVAMVNADPDVDSFYLAASELPQPNATATSTAGVGGVVDVPQGLPQFDLIRESTQEKLATLAVASLPRTVTYVPFRFGN